MYFSPAISNLQKSPKNTTKNSCVLFTNSLLTFQGGTLKGRSCIPWQQKLGRTWWLVVHISYTCKLLRGKGDVSILWRKNPSEDLRTEDLNRENLENHLAPNVLFHLLVSTSLFKQVVWESSSH